METAAQEGHERISYKLDQLSTWTQGTKVGCKSLVTLHTSMSVYSNIANEISLGYFDAFFLFTIGAGFTYIQLRPD